MSSAPWKGLVRWLPVALGLLLMVGLLAWLMGAFRTRVVPSGPALPPQLAAGVPLHTVAMRRVPRTETAVGTIRAVRETAVAARILGRVRSLGIDRAGQAVVAGEVLCELDADDLQASVSEARAALVAAETRRDKAKLDLDRTAELVTSGVAAPDRQETDAAAFRAAEAEVERSRQFVTGAESLMAFATIRAPIAGIVVDKKVQVGDVVQPGQLICTLYDPTRLQLVAVLREELAGVLVEGQEVDVTIDALGKQCRGTVAEIVPEAAAQSRSFEVKVVGPCQPGIVTGMFGRLHVPLGERDFLAVPRSAVRSVGQLDFVYAVDASRVVQRRYVRIGADAGTEVEILSGLAPSEQVVADAAVHEREER